MPSRPLRPICRRMRRRRIRRRLDTIRCRRSSRTLTSPWDLSLLECGRPPMCSTAKRRSPYPRSTTATATATASDLCSSIARKTMYIVVVKLKKNASRLGSCTVFPVRAISASSQPHRASKSRLRRLGVHHVLRLLLEHARMQLVAFLQGEKTLFLSRPAA